MLRLLFATFTPPEPIFQKFLGPTEKFSNFISWAPVVAELVLFLAVIFIALWFNNKRRGVKSKSEIAALKKHKKTLFEEAGLTIAFVFGLSFVGAMYWVL